MKLKRHKNRVRSIILGISVTALTACTVTQATVQAQTLADVTKNIEKNHFKEAQSQLRTILKNEPANAAAYYQMGDVYLFNYLLDSARYYYEKGIAANANEPLNYVGMGRYYLESLDKPKAKEQFNKALSKAGEKNAYVMQQIADAYVYDIVTEEGPWAVQLAEKAKNLDKKNLSYMITLGDAYRLIPGESVKGLEQYRAAATADAKYAPAYYRQGQLYYKLKNVAEGDKFMNQAIAADASFAPVYKEMAEQQADAGNLAKAIEYYKKYIDIAGFAPLAQTTLAGYYFTNKQFNEVKTELDKAAVYDPNNVLVLRLPAYADFYLGNYKKGLEEMDKYFKTVKTEKIIGQDYKHYGLLLQLNGQDSMAITNYKKGIEKDSTFYELYDTLASTYLRLKRYEDAAAIMETKVRNLKSHNYKVNPQDYYNIARNYYLGSNFIKADENLNMVNQLYPTWIGGYKFHAQVAIKLDPNGEKGLAAPLWNKVIELGEADTKTNSKDLQDAYNFFAEYNYNQKNYGAVMCYANKMMALDASNANAKKLLGYLPKGTKEECPAK